MKNILVLLFSCCLLAFVYARERQALPAAYPTVFTAVYNVSDIAQGLPGRMTTFYLDMPNKRARSVLPFGPNSGDYLLIFRPPGADPSSSYGQNYTQFIINPPYPYNTTKCVYQQIDDMGPWPDNWMHAANSQFFEEVGPFYVLPFNLQYTGPYFVAELGIMTDRWDSTDICKLPQSGIGNVPCKSVMFTQGDNPVPAMDIQAEGGSKFGTESYFVRVYHIFETSVSDSDFALPDQWQKRCGNADAGYKMSPTLPFTVYDDGTISERTVISLSKAPIQELGPVTVVFKANPDDEYTCADCVTVDKKLTFTADNWNVPQRVPFTYHKPGCSNMQVQATGGGYNWAYRESSWTVFTCEGTAVKGCSSRPKC